MSLVHKKQPEDLVEMQREEALAAHPRQMAQESRHQTDTVGRRGAFTELVDEQERPRRAATYHLGHLPRKRPARYIVVRTMLTTQALQCWVAATS